MEEEVKKAREEIEEVEGRLQASVVAEVRRSIRGLLARLELEVCKAVKDMFSTFSENLKL